ncbi:MAG: JAB domain-containing protein [Methanomicrobiales archaeon]
MQKPSPNRAASIICVPNHPSGSLEPRPSDIAVTTQLMEAGLLLGIQLIAHIIVTKRSYMSMNERRTPLANRRK